MNNPQYQKHMASRNPDYINWQVQERNNGGNEVKEGKITYGNDYNPEVDDYSISDIEDIIDKVD
ncbi:MAG: hypothetical protein ACK55Z_08595 [bacterium]|jgi:hypothetical protein